MPLSGFFLYYHTVLVFLMVGLVGDVGLERLGLKGSLLVPGVVAGTLAYIFSFIKTLTPEHGHRLIDAAFRLVIFSAFLSSIALTIGENLLPIEGSGFFSNDPPESDAWPKAFLVLLSVPFHALTIVLAVKLMRIAVAKRWSLGLMGSANILLSLCLAVLLCTAIRLVEYDYDPTKLPEALSSAFLWVKGIVSDGAPQTGQVDDVLLMPLVLTAFVPVLLYMGSFVFLAFLLRPAAAVASYMCGLLGEKQKTPFAELAVVLSLFLTMVKALQDWEYLQRLFQQ